MGSQYRPSFECEAAALLQDYCLAFSVNWPRASWSASF
jgi:hypothetical protein